MLRTLKLNGIFYFNNMSRDAYGIIPIDLNLRQGARRFEQCHGSFTIRKGGEAMIEGIIFMAFWILSVAAIATKKGSKNGA
jgi:hypothetical protein